ncbi:FtsW/RodA/SpoVE family cell cycle protein [Brevibacillus centrosporus]|uniref:Rod shape-determining protein RodA n=1 Tax=Brevibacillus centrosporus TaxID=54910 RepID=A0A1I3WPM0_9BACL|nr:FtsW/RodA/SpoVE family cell cycle protein [Brevibacillus centrosporus]MEC2131125.1 FtsW/RodA/SpoVE family cell cycle protein [Brevibacillus centrosporus]MED4911761.1 FtsW/RodA/SpoVE family cell cycle protein [Brevibacillus centrosporus]RNB72975.1 rod shape-determining protein RodA [Brevibacillus centrosporus]SFK09320.1 rod shape-determining protein RodA [Brevibacillus centrosporus]GED31799.1 cell division protein FtsW [Brevibacillus centrosporus]
MDLEKRHLKTVDWTIIMILVGLGIFSYLGISGSAAGVDKAHQQVIWYIVGFVVLVGTLLFDYRLFYNMSYVLYAIGLILLIGVFQTKPINNTTSWYDLGPVLLQPSEPMKLFTILTVARFMAKRAEDPDRFYYFYKLIPVASLVGVPLLLILVQPDLGTALVYTGMLATMLIVGGIRLKHVVYVGALVGSFFAGMTLLYQYKQEIFFKIIKPYQWDRIIFWMDPDLEAMGRGFQLKQALIAIGSGQLFGKGIDTPTQASFGWVPVGESDFIFTVIAEKLGFMGAGLLMILFFFLIYRMIRIAMEAKDPFGSYVVAGVVGMLTFQIFENIGMTIQLMPITGIPLPFISYGGSSLITNFLIIGVVLNVGMRKDKLRFD